MTAPPGTRDVRRALRTLFPHLRLAIVPHAEPGTFVITMPSAAAREMRLGTDLGWAGQWFTRQLGTPAEIAAVEFVRRRYGPTAVVTLATHAPSPIAAVS